MNLCGAHCPDVFLMKISTGGNLWWTELYDNNALECHAAGEVISTFNGGWAIAGMAGEWFYCDPERAFIVITDHDGLSPAIYNYGGPDALSFAIDQAPDSTFYVAGALWNDDWEAWVFKIDLNGSYVWGGHSGGLLAEELADIMVTPDGGCVAVGYTATPDSTLDAYVVRYDSGGNLLWERTYGGTGNDFAYAVKQAADGCYVIAGYTDSWGAGLEDMWLFKIDPSAIGSTEPLPERTTSHVELVVSPNPVIGSSSIDITVASPGYMELKLYNINGQLVQVLYDRFLPSTRFKTPFSPVGLPSGLYFLQLKTNQDQAVKKIIIMR
jgi:hypothetical protein